MLGFTNRNVVHYLASCRCGAKLNANLQNLGKSGIITVYCDYTRGAGGICGKPYLRNPIRKNVAEVLEKDSVEAYRTKQADDLMTREIDPEPPIIRRPEVLYQVKREANAAKYCHPDPIQALAMMKKNEWFDSIGEIGHDPFYVHYSTNSGMQAYKRMCLRASQKGEKICVAADSTGGVVRKIGEKYIFLHVLVVGVPEGQISLAHMISETAHTESICHWLRMWRRAGATIPDICVTDWSRALLHGVASAFTGHQTIEDYAEHLPDVKIFIRLDVAHTVHKYARYCKKYRKQVKTFLMACLGQLIIASSKYEAEQIIRNIFIVCLSETNGNLKTGEKSPADLAESELIKLITKGMFLFIVYFVNMGQKKISVTSVWATEYFLFSLFVKQANLKTFFYNCYTIYLFVYFKNTRFLFLHIVCFNFGTLAKNV